MPAAVASRMTRSAARTRCRAGASTMALTSGGARGWGPPGDRRRTARTWRAGTAPRPVGRGRRASRARAGRPSPRGSGGRSTGNRCRSRTPPARRWPRPPARGGDRDVGPEHVASHDTLRRAGERGEHRGDEPGRDVPTDMNSTPTANGVMPRARPTASADGPRGAPTRAAARGGGPEHRCESSTLRVSAPRLGRVHARGAGIVVASAPASARVTPTRARQPPRSALHCPDRPSPSRRRRRSPWSASRRRTRATGAGLRGSDSRCGRTAPTPS